MIIYLGDGYIGNQIFQYVFLKTIQKHHESIIVSGFRNLKEVFVINDIKNINQENRWVGVILRIVRRVLLFLSDQKIISSITINREKILGKYEREAAAFSATDGMLKNITFVKPGFFQSESFFKEETVSKLQIKNKYTSEANRVLSGVSGDKYKIFIHIRRGDYKTFMVYGKSPLLPIDYYKDQISWFQKNKKDCFFIFLSDDTEFVKEEFEYIKNKLISTKNHFGTDLAIMTQCNGAILSPSSFGWWGSYLMKERDIVFAPKDWLGFGSGIEFPAKGAPSYAEEKSVS